MMITSFKLSAFALICFSISSIHLAQNSQQDYLNSHNVARAQLGIPNMVWNTSVAAYADKYVTQRILECNMVHSGGPYGENLAKGSTDELTGVVAVKLWVSEKPYYDHNTNTCVDGRVCGHYTQVVWRDSNQLGCSRAQCLNDDSSLVICSYYPSGNYVGQAPY